MSGRDWILWLAVILAVMILMIILIAGSTFVPSAAVVNL